MGASSRFYQLDQSIDGEVEMAGGAPGLQTDLAGRPAEASKTGGTTEAAILSKPALLGKIPRLFILDSVPCASLTVSGIGSGLTLDHSTETRGAGDTYYFCSNLGAARIADFASYAIGAQAF